MSWWSAFNTCWPPGESGCVVWWDAWAAIGAWTAAVATVFVAVAARKTSERAVDIASKQHQETLDARRASARIIGCMLVHEVSRLPHELFAQFHAMDRNKPRRYDGEFPEPDVEARISAVRRCCSSFLPGAERLQDRLHHLPDAIGDDLAALIGYSRTLNHLAQSCFEATQRKGNPAHVENAFLMEMRAVRSYIRLFQVAAIPYANEFRAFVGVEPRDYSGCVLNKERD